MIDFLKDIFFRFWNCPKSMDSLTRIILFIPILSLIIFLLPWFFSQPSFYLKYIVVDIRSNDIKHVQPNELKKIVINQLNGTALTSDLVSIYNSVISHPWIKEATVRRIWPNKILISLVEHNIVGVWSDGRFISQAGKLLKFDKFESDTIAREKKCYLIQLDGPPGSELTVLNKAREISERANSVGLVATGFQLSAQYDWRVYFSNGMKMELGGENLATPLDKRLDNFFNSVGWFYENKNSDLVSVDLRYAQGFAFQERKSPKLKKITSTKKKSNLKSCIQKNYSNKAIS